MKNKKLLKALAAFTMSIAAAGSMSLFGCAHKHTYSDEWDRSAEGHWHNATCKHTDEKTEIEPHIYTDSTDATCNVCGYEREIVTPQPPTHSHTWSDWKVGNGKHWKECTADGCTDPVAKSEEGDHVFGEVENGKKTCLVCGHSETVTVPDDLATAKEEAKTELAAYKNDKIAEIDATEYAEILAQITAKKTEGAAAIDAATTEEAVGSALATAKSDIDGLIAQTQSTEEVLAQAVADLRGYADENKQDKDPTEYAKLLADIEAVVTKYSDTTDGLLYAEGLEKAEIIRLLGVAKAEIDELVRLDSLSRQEFTVTFKDGETVLSTQTIKYNGKAEKPSDPIKDGNKFLGWYLGEELFDFETPITENINVAAKWRQLSDYDKYLAQFGDKVIYNNDFDTPVDRLDSFSGTYGTKGVYFLFNSKNNEEAGDKYYVTVADGYAKMVDGGASGTQIVFDFGKNYVKTLEGYTEIKTNSTGNSWTFMQFIGSNNSEVLGLRTDNNNIKYRLNGGSVATPSATIAATDTTYKIYYKFDFTTGKVFMTVNGQSFFGESGLDAGITAIKGIKFVSSDNGQRTVDVDNFVVAGEAKTLDEYKTEVTAKLDTAYGAYTLTDYPENGKELTDIYTAAKTALGTVESFEKADEVLNTAIADMKAVLTIAGNALQEAKTVAITELEGTDKTDYTINAEAVASAIAKGVEAINAADTAEKVTEALNAAKAAIAEIDNDEAALPKAKAAAITALEAHDGGAGSFTVEGEGGNKTAYEQALAAGTKAINDITVSETLSYVDAITAINTALEEAKTAIDAIDNDGELLEKAKASAIEEIDNLVKEKKAEIDAKIEAGEITDIEKAAEVKAEIDAIRNARVRAIEDADTLGSVATEKTQAINNIETEAATLTATPEQLRELAEKAIREHAAPFIENYPEYKEAVEKIRDDAITLLASKTDKDEISALQTTTTRKISVYVAVHEAYKAIDKYAAELKEKIYNDGAKAKIDAEIKRGSELDSNEWSKVMWQLHLTEEVANVEINKQAVIDALDKIVTDLEATVFTVTIVGVDNVTASALYGQALVIDTSKLPDNMLIKALFTDESMAEDTVYDLDAPVYDEMTLYAQIVEATTFSDSQKFKWADIKVDELTPPNATDPTNKDQAVLTNANLTAANAFLKVSGTDFGATAKYRTTTDNSKPGVTGGIIQITGEALQVEFNGTGTLTIAVRSGGDTKFSKFAIKNADGDYIPANVASITGDIKQPDVNSNMYTVTGKAYSDVVFTIDKAGVYTICQFSGEGFENVLRLAKIEKSDTWKVENDLFVTWGDGEQESYHHSQEITVPEYTGEGALLYWYVEGDEEGTHYTAGQKVTLTAGAYKMVAKTAEANVTITYVVDGEDNKEVSYYVAEGNTGVINTVADPVKEGYTFKGWYTTATPDDTDSPFDFGAVAPLDTITVYAVFEKVKALSVNIDASTDTNTSGHALKFTSAEQYYSVTSVGNFKYSAGVGLIGTSKGRGITVTAGTNIESLTITVKMKLGSSSSLAGIGKATVTGTGVTIPEESNIVASTVAGQICEFTITLTAGQSITITSDGSTVISFEGVEGSVIPKA